MSLDLPGSPRLSWSDLPAHTHDGVAAILGSAVVSASPRSGGFSPGSADVVITANGDRAFVKAVSVQQNPDTPNLIRREHAVLLDLAARHDSDRFPQIYGLHDHDGWVALVVQEVPGVTPMLPWRHADVVSAFEALAEVGSWHAPRGWPLLEAELAPDFGAGSMVIENPPKDLDPWVAQHGEKLRDLSLRALPQMAGERVIHLDIRADNLLIDVAGTTRVIDWPWATRGAAWADSAMLLLNVTCFDVAQDSARASADTDDRIDEYVARVCSVGAREDDVYGMIAGLTGLMLDNSRRPHPPGLPTVRAFQKAHALGGIRLLRRWYAG